MERFISSEIYQIFLWATNCVITAVLPSPPPYLTPFRRKSRLNLNRTQHIETNHTETQCVILIINNEHIRMFWMESVEWYNDSCYRGAHCLCFVCVIGVIVRDACVLVNEVGGGLIFDLVTTKNRHPKIRSRTYTHTHTPTQMHAQTLS